MGLVGNGLMADEPKQWPNGNGPNGDGLMGYGAGPCWAARGRAHIVYAYICIMYVYMHIIYAYIRSAVHWSFAFFTTAAVRKVFLTLVPPSPPSLRTDSRK